MSLWLSEFTGENFVAVKSFALIDGTGFYAHSSAQFHPGLKGKPVLVSAGQGISIAGANIKEFGIPKFSPIWEIDSKVAMHHGAIFKCNFNTLGQISRNFKQSLIDVSEGLPIFHYSVDESWVETTELLKNGIDLESEAWRWREHIWKTTGVPTGVGIGPSLTLSKLASFAAKKLQGSNGVFVISKDNLIQTLEKVPVSEVWNVGRKLSKHFSHMGIYSALDLARQDPKKMQKAFSISVANTVHELNGTPVYNWNDTRPKKQQIWSTSSYRDRLQSRESIMSELSLHLAEAFFKLRAQKSEALAITAFVSTSIHDDPQEQFKASRSIHLSYGVCDTSVGLKTLRAIQGDLIPTQPTKTRIYKVGVGLTSLIDAEHKQADLFEHDVNNHKLSKAIDCINTRFGKGTIEFGARTKRYSERPGNVKLLELENYFSDFNELLEVKCI